MSVIISPSILAADLGHLTDEVARAEEGGCDTFHVDIMDGHFVPNLSYGPYVVATMRRLTRLPLDVHLMVDNPLAMIGPFADAGSDYLTVHIEVTDDPVREFDAIRDRGVNPGISLKPDTPPEAIFPCLGEAGLTLVMSVYPGFGGQAFIPDSYARIRAIAEEARRVNPSMILSVDGGVTFENAAPLVDAGVNYLVAGTTVFRDHGAAANVRRLREAALGRVV